MMAPVHPNGPTDGPFPSAGTLAQLRESLRGYLRSGRTVADEETVCAALGSLAEEAHERRLHGEQMLVAFKTVWQDMPEVASIADRREQQRLLARVVTLCIDVYYQRR